MKREELKGVAVRKAAFMMIWDDVKTLVRVNNDRKTSFQFNTKPWRMLFCLLIPFSIWKLAIIVKEMKRSFVVILKEGKQSNILGKWAAVSVPHEYTCFIIGSWFRSNKFLKAPNFSSNLEIFMHPLYYLTIARLIQQRSKLILQVTALVDCHFHHLVNPCIYWKMTSG